MEGGVSLLLPTKLHAIVQFALLMLLRREGVRPLPELMLQLLGNAEILDVCVTGDFPGPYPTEPALLCCEILSPEDRLGNMLSKCEEYHAWGVPFCWVIDPVKRTALGISRESRAGTRGRSSPGRRPLCRSRRTVL